MENKMVQMTLVEGLPEELKELIVDTVEPVSSKHVHSMLSTTILTSEASPTNLIFLLIGRLKL